MRYSQCRRADNKRHLSQTARSESPNYVGRRETKGGKKVVGGGTCHAAGRTCEFKTQSGQEWRGKEAQPPLITLARSAARCEGLISSTLLTSQAESVTLALVYIALSLSGPAHLVAAPHSRPLCLIRKTVLLFSRPMTWRRGLCSRRCRTMKQNLSHHRKQIVYAAAYRCRCDCVSSS